ncbi:MAG: response regulator [bacterium]
MKHILVVEDNLEDFAAMQRAFKQSRFANPVIHCQDGDSALDYLFQRGEYENPEKSPRPGLILLDLNLPGTDGREVLNEIKKDTDLRKIPVIVLTTSTDERDIEKCYEFGANTYIRKPVSFDGFLKAIQCLHDYWFEIAILPERETRFG